MRNLTAVLLFSGLSLATGLAQGPAPAERQLQIKFDGSNVTLLAANVSIPEIMREWARLSGSVVVNAERLPATPLAAPMRFEKQPQTVVLQALLRQAAGFIATPRRANRPGATDFEMIYILATSSPTASGYSSFTPVQSTNIDNNSEIPPVPPAPPQQPQQPQEAPAAPKPTSSTTSPAVPIIAMPPAPGSSTTPPPPTGRGRGGV